MHHFWRDIFGRTWKQFAVYAKEARFLAFLVGAVLIAIYGAYWKGISESLSWVVVPLLVLVFLSALKGGIEDHYEEQEKLAVKRGDEIVALKATIRDLQEQLQERADDAAEAAVMAQTITQLQALQTQGIDLAADIRRTYIANRHPPRIQQWKVAVEACLQARCPDHLVAFQIPLPPYPNPRDLESIKVSYEVTERINRIQEIITALRN